MHHLCMIKMCLRCELPVTVELSDVRDLLWLSKSAYFHLSRSISQIAFQDLSFIAFRTHDPKTGAKSPSIAFIGDRYVVHFHEFPVGYGKFLIQRLVFAHFDKSLVAPIRPKMIHKFQ